MQTIKNDKKRINHMYLCMYVHTYMHAYNCCIGQNKKKEKDKDAVENGDFNQTM